MYRFSVLFHQVSLPCCRNIGAARPSNAGISGPDRRCHRDAGVREAAGRDTLEPCLNWYFSATASRSGTPTTSSPDGTTSTSPSWAESEARDAGRLLADRGRPGPADSPHVGAGPGHPDGRAGPRGGRAVVAAGPSALAAQRAPLRRPAGEEQGGDRGRARDGPGLAWRRSYATPPPPVEPGSPHHPAGDPRYRDVPVEALPTTECLADVVARVLPYWEDAIVPDLLAEGARGGAVLVVAHGNSLRALRKHIDGSERRGDRRPGDPDRHPLPLRVRQRPDRGVRGLPGRSRSGPGGGRGRAPPGGLTQRANGGSAAQADDVTTEGRLVGAGPLVIQVRLSPQTTP